MTATLEGAVVPQWRLCDRMRRALDEADIEVGAMARYLEVHRKTVGSWINGHNRPSPAALRMWALLTGVDYDWLRDGVCAARDSNPEPAGSEPASAPVRYLAVAA